MAALHLRGCPKNCVCQLTGIHFWVTELLSKSSCSQTCVCPPPPSFECLSFTALSDFCAVWHQKAVFTMIAKSVNHPGKWQAGGSGRERQRHHSAYYTVPSTWIEAVISKLKKKKKSYVILLSECGPASVIYDITKNLEPVLVQYSVNTRAIWKLEACSFSYPENALWNWHLVSSSWTCKTLCKCCGVGRGVGGGSGENPQWNVGRLQRRRRLGGRVA